MELEQTKIFGVKINDLPVEATINIIKNNILTKEKTIISNANIHALNLTFKIAWFRNFLNESDLVFCDGFGVLIGAYLLNQPIHYRYTPPDWINKLGIMCCENHFTLGLIGSKTGVAEKTGSILKDKLPGLDIAFTYHGYFNKTPGNPENEAVIELINLAKPDILLVGFGMPMQEKWLLENFDRLDVKVALPVGAAFDYVSGNVRRAPKWMTDHGLEWLGRLIIEPRRLWKRYIIGNPLFFWRILKQKFGLLKYPE
ncbi:MAG: glycosyltransferase [Chloroflexi bacterium HGW-Chloroflexi-10]|nr:MAG: glycosyltransferase [Chloroflexi bacterium HGW-Chloroflexi-10]